MAWLEIIPTDPHDAVRDRLRDLASQDRPGDPWAIPFDARATPFRLLSLAPALLVCMAPVATVALLWSRLP